MSMRQAGKPDLRRKSPPRSAPATQAPYPIMRYDKSRWSSPRTLSQALGLLWGTLPSATGCGSIATCRQYFVWGRCGWRVGMSSSTVELREALATRVEVSEDTLSVDLADGRTIAAPLAWYPRLAHATAEERGSWRLIGGGRGVHSPEIDEDISVANLLAGQPSMESQNSFKKWLANRAKPSRSPKRTRA